MNIPSLLLLASLSMPIESGKHSYDIALDYCRDKGGLAQYTQSGDTIRFSCSNDLTRVITINR
jgi:hypothetical protein